VSGGITPQILNLGTMEVSDQPHILATLTPVSILQETGWPQSQPEPGDKEKKSLHSP